MLLCITRSRKLWQPEAINTTENRLSISQSAGPPVSGQHCPWLMWYFHSLLRLARWCSAQSRPASTPRMLSQHTENTPHGRDSDPSRSPDTTCNIVQHCHYRSIIFRVKKYSRFEKKIRIRIRIIRSALIVKQPKLPRKPPVGYDLCGQGSQLLMWYNCLNAVDSYRKRGKIASLKSTPFF